MKDSVLRAEMATVLSGGQAHVDLKKAIDGLKPENRTKTPIKGEPSIWEILEHIRIAQHDILRYTMEANWQSPDWPSGYWPAVPSSKGPDLTEEGWNTTIEQLRQDLDEVIKIVQDPKTDLTAEIPHAREHTYLREILLVADHNAYHLAQIVAIRKALGDWPA